MRWDLANEIDVRALSTAGESLPDIDRELQLRLKDRTLMQKCVDQAAPASTELPIPWKLLPHTRLVLEAPGASRPLHDAYDWSPEVGWTPRLAMPRARTAKHSRDWADATFCE